ncbi:MAG: hypothetical protein JWO11_2047 [Nocardioides sp.]|nr:hypothetical protein [Nocardioides sp.]
MIMKVRWVGICLLVTVALAGCTSGNSSGSDAEPNAAQVTEHPSASQAGQPGDVVKMPSSRPTEKDPEPVWPPGLFDDIEAPIGTMTFRGTGRWVGSVGGVSVALYAGADGQHPRTGAVMLMRADHQRPSGIWRLPNSGRLHVESAHGHVVELVDAEGNLHTFNAATGVWARGGPTAPVSDKQMPCNPGFGFPKASPPCPDNEATTGWLTRRPNGSWLLEPIQSYDNDAEGRAFARANNLEYPFSNDYYDASVGRPEPFRLDADTICTGVLTVGYREPMKDHVVDCQKVDEALNRSPRTTVAVWISDKHVVQLSELYRP